MQNRGQREDWWSISGTLSLWVFIVAARRLFGAYSPVLGFSQNRSESGSKLIPYFDAVTFWYDLFTAYAPTAELNRRYC